MTSPSGKADNLDPQRATRALQERGGLEVTSALRGLFPLYMSPCLSTIQASTPKCPGAHTNMNTLAGLAKHIPCGRPMHWDAMAEQWTCPLHGKRSIEVDLGEVA